MFKHILIATDGTELAEKAVAHGLALAKHLGAKATAVTVSGLGTRSPWRRWRKEGTQPDRRLRRAHGRSR